MFAKTYARYFDVLNSRKPYKQDIEFVCKWAGNPKSIIDIGCGTASYWKYFPKDVYLSGIEKSPYMIEQSKYKDEIIEGDVEDGFFPFGYDCAIALFDVINYIPNHDWWQNLPIRKGGCFIFDLWDKEKVDKDKFTQTIRGVEGVVRIISPVSYDGKTVKLNVTIANKDFEETELHTMYVYSEKDINKFCGKHFKIVDKKETKGWQAWFKIVKK